MKEKKTLMERIEETIYIKGCIEDFLKQLIKIAQSITEERDKDELEILFKKAKILFFTLKILIEYYKIRFKKEHHG